MSQTSPVTVQSNMQADNTQRCILAHKNSISESKLALSSKGHHNMHQFPANNVYTDGWRDTYFSMSWAEQEHFWTNWRDKKKNAHFIVTGRDGTSSLKPSSPLVLLIFNLRWQKSWLSYLRHIRECTWKYSLTRATKRMHRKPANVTAAQRPNTCKCQE